LKTKSKPENESRPYRQLALSESGCYMYCNRPQYVAKKRTCLVCGKLMSGYNLGKTCFIHASAYEQSLETAREELRNERRRKTEHSNNNNS
jgi:hypothetical protein